MSARDRIAAPGPKKMLALDGGGIRGLIAIEFLGKIESELRKALGRDDIGALARRMAADVIGVRVDGLATAGGAVHDRRAVAVGDVPRAPTGSLVGFAISFPCRGRQRPARSPATR